MASAPGACCIQTHFHEGKASGSHSELFGLDTYQVGDGVKVIVIVTDIYGHKYNNVLLVADALAKGGYKVLIPDVLQGDAVPASHGDLGPWLEKHTQEVTQPIVDGFLKKVRSELKPSFVGGVGYCFGAKYVVNNLGSQGLFDAGCAAHPSFVTMDEIKAVEKPVLFSCAEEDPIFTPESRFEATKALAAKKGVRYQFDLFSGTTHGYAVRGDIKDPAVKYAAEKTLGDQLCWFDTFAKGGCKM
ncbi:hypothetical protein DICA3_C15192 [Diutina catenulata]